MSFSQTSILIILKVILIETSISLPFHRRIVFNDKIKGILLPELQSIGASSEKFEKSCAAKCNLNAKCSSYSFCGRNYCQLNTIDRFHEQFESAVKENPICIYAGMSKTEKPECETFGIEIKITNDSITPNLCEINLKRLDGYWGSGSVTYEEGTNYRMRIRSGVCYQAHQGFLCPERYLRTYKVQIIRARATFHGAVQVCIKAGGQLFDDVVDVDGFLQFLRREWKGFQAWVGVSDPSNKGVYRNMAGEDVTSQIRWNPSEVSASIMTHLVRIKRNGFDGFINTHPTANTRIFACEIEF